MNIHCLEQQNFSYVSVQQSHSWNVLISDSNIFKTIFNGIGEAPASEVCRYAIDRHYTVMYNNVVFQE